MNKSTPKSVDEYISALPKDTQKVLIILRKTIKDLAPQAVESISYQMPGYKLNTKVLIYFGGWKDHIAIYPTASKLETVLPEVAKYRTGKGTLRFDLKNPLPLDLIQKIIMLRVKEVSKK